MKWQNLIFIMLIGFTAVGFLIPLARAADQYSYVNTNWQFGLPTYHTYINFSSTQTFSSVSRTGDYLYFNGYGFRVQNGNLTITRFFEGTLSSRILQYTAYAPSSTTSTHNIYGGATLGEPIAVTGATSWSYNPTTYIITVTVLHSSPAVIEITWPTSPGAATSATSALQQFLNFLAEGDWLGFLQAIYVSAFMSVDLFWGFIILLIMAPIYIRTRSLILVCILWILIGGGIIVAAPMVAMLGIAFLALGITGILVKIFTTLR